jgi:hypothetical protein
MPFCRRPDEREIRDTQYRYLSEARTRLGGQMRIAGLIGAAVVCLLIATHNAYACPQGTVFSAYNGNGICAYVGQGAKVAVQCTKMVNSCPPGTSHEHKSRGDTGDYCCSKNIANEQRVECVWRGTPPICDGACGGQEQTRAAAGTRDRARDLASDYASSFGKNCSTGNKALCCHHVPN